MSLIHDYFLLYHGLQTPHENNLKINTNLSDEEFFELSALILSITRHQLSSFSALENFKTMCEKLSTQTVLNNEDLYSLQHALITHFLNHRSYAQVHLFDTPLEFLVNEKVLSIENHKKLCSLFEHKDEEEHSLPEHKADSSDFLHNKHALMVAINELKALFINTSALDDLLHYLDEQKFSIGITGVMNAGKSSMINALMGEEILGTNVIPETANLSLIKYSTTPYAKVIYWNVAQWTRIEESALEIDSMQNFVSATKAQFKDELSTYICDTSREDLIDITRLGEYTSAKGKHSNLVKMIELGSDLHFLKENIELVDTPGLDDVVIQREEITKEYIAQCDLMIHLMNVSQSATQKDVEFIIDAVRFQNITQLLIVITRVDMVSKKDVQEVIAYTKNSIERKLKEIESNASVDFILKNLRFIALSSKMALHHKLGESDIALEAGYTLEKSGLLEIESYLHSTLYGTNSQRSNLILHAAKKRLYKTAEQNTALLEYELSLLSKSEDELDIEMRSNRRNQEQSEKKLSALTQEIHSFKETLRKHQLSLFYILNEESIKLQTLLKQRLLDESAYALSKDKSRPTLKRIQPLIENSLRHGLSDILRDYRYGLMKKMSRLKASILSYYPQSNSAKESDFESLSLDKIFTITHHQITIQSSLELFIKKIVECANSTKLSALDEALKIIIDHEFITLNEALLLKTQEIDVHLIEEFFIHINTPIQEIKIGIEEQKALLKKYTQRLHGDDESTQSQSLELHSKIKNIELILGRCAL